MSLLKQIQEMTESSKKMMIQPYVADNVINIRSNVATTANVFNNTGSWSKNTLPNVNTSTWNMVASDYSGNNIIACDYTGIYTSSDAGINWISRQNDTGLPVPATLLENINWKSVASNYNGSILFACTNTDIYIKTSSSSSWVNQNTNGFAIIPLNQQYNGSQEPNLIYPKIQSIACDSTGNQAIACTETDIYIYSSSSDPMWTVLTSSGLVYAGDTTTINYQQNANFIVRNSNNNNKFPNWNCLACTADGTRLVVCNNNNIYYSTNSGSEWTLQDKISYQYPVTSNSSNNNNNNKNNKIQHWKSVAIVSISGYTLIAVCGIGGIYLHSGLVSDSNIFIKITEGIPVLPQEWTNITLKYNIATKKVNLCVCSIEGIYTSSGIFSLNDFDPTSFVDVIRLSTLTKQTTGLPLQKQFWNSIASSADGTKIIALNSYNNNSGIYTSTNSGAKWTLQKSSLFNLCLFTSIASSADGSKLIACNRYNSTSIYTSTDAGMNWTQRTTGLPTTAYNLRWVCLASSADGTKLIACTNTSIYISINSGINWTIQTTRLPIIPANDIVNDYNKNSQSWVSVACNFDGSLIAVCNKTSIYIYINNTWFLQTNGLPFSDMNPSWTSITMSAYGTVYACNSTDNNVYTLNLFSLSNALNQLSISIKNIPEYKKFDLNYFFKSYFQWTVIPFLLANNNNNNNILRWNSITTDYVGQYIYICSDKNIYFINTIYSTDTINRVWSSYYALSNPTISRYTSITSDYYGNVFVCTDNGVYFLNQTTGGVLTPIISGLVVGKLTPITHRVAVNSDSSKMVSTFDSFVDNSYNGIYTYSRTPSSAIPFITSFSPLNGPNNTLITITGKNFPITNSFVYLGNTKITPDTRTSTKIEFKSPILENTNFSRLPLYVTTGSNDSIVSLPSYKLYRYTNKTIVTCISTQQTAIQTSNINVKSGDTIYLIGKFLDDVTIRIGNYVLENNIIRSQSIGGVDYRLLEFIIPPNPSLTISSYTIKVIPLYTPSITLTQKIKYTTTPNPAIAMSSIQKNTISLTQNFLTTFSSLNKNNVLQNNNNTHHLSLLKFN